MGYLYLVFTNTEVSNNIMNLPVSVYLTTSCTTYETPSCVSLLDTFHYSRDTFPCLLLHIFPCLLLNSFPFLTPQTRPP